MSGFRVGDKVRYCSKDNWDGSIGTLIEVDCQGYEGKVCKVAWESGRAYEYQEEIYLGRGYMYNYAKWMVLAEPEILKYDPTQQGDTDEDI